MKTARAIGTALLALTFVLGLVLAFAPLGNAWVEDDTARVSEQYSMFSKDRDTTAVGVAADGSSGQTWYYVDAGLDGSGGITWLAAMGPMLVGGMVFIVAAMILTIVPRTSPSIIGGLVALPGALLMVGSVVLAVLGMPLHASHKLGAVASVDFAGFSAAAAIAIIISALAATGMGLVSMRSSSKDDSYHHAGEHGGWVAGRTLRCPDCATEVTAGYGIVPICPTCHFGSDYRGPAGAPVQVRAQ